MSAQQSTVISAVRYLPHPKFSHYLVGTDGSIWSKRSRRTKNAPDVQRLPGGWIRHKGAINRYGYRNHRLWIHKRYKNLTAHRLVLETFVGPCPSGMQAAHGNGKRADNRIENLRWATISENSNDRIAQGTSFHGIRHPLHKLTELDVREIRRLLQEKKLSHGDIAKRFNVCRATVDHIKSGYNWSHLT